MANIFELYSKQRDLNKLQNIKDTFQKIQEDEKEEFKKSTPAKLFKLLEIHQDINTPKENKKKSNHDEKYIDQINF